MCILILAAHLFLRSYEPIKIPPRFAKVRRNGLHREGHRLDGTSGHGAHEWHPHGPRLAINGVLLLICIGALLAAVPSYLGEMQHQPNWVETMVSHSSAAGGIPSHDHAGGDHAAHHALSFTGIADVHAATSVVASAAGILGILVAVFFHLINRGAADRLRAALLSNGLTRWLPLALENKWKVDEIYHVVFRLPAWVLGHVPSSTAPRACRPSSGVSSSRSTTARSRATPRPWRAASR